MKKLMTLVAIAVTISATSNAFAHGEQPKHGGIVQESGNGISLELVNKDGKTTIYVEDHGKPVATAGASGKLTVLKGADKSELSLEPGGENTLIAKGEAKLGAGAKAIAAVTLSDKKTASVRFAVK
ncbi:hypothetical protein [Noviherbaspirillum denitrificans]|uniref:Uncharacterized protein n=1 Tax=Noviherbaspirillum denitrificans TaxID=1968433 RepID=A0A254TJT2_9BURK|nr:hypothetical protein [Noviherbaspirillum denitrificans]OWW22891.1 hypothetical protein AYR66_15760 [Noviherbaspirillum denitrificans]